LAALMEARGELVAVERDPARARRLRENAQRMRAANVEVRSADARDDHGDGFDRVLVDPPCTGLGTLRSRPDQRWRVEDSDPARLAKLQGGILAAAGRAVRPGGVLVYSTCTISPAENEAVVEAFLDSRTDFSAEDLHAEHPLWKHPAVPRHLQLLPHRDGTDGFFVARLRRHDG
jgi:16S rRNA (cytosine967-C5)-methyltransferase